MVDYKVVLDEILEERGKNYKTIALELGMSSSYVYNIISTRNQDTIERLVDDIKYKIMGCDVREDLKNYAYENQLTLSNLSDALFPDKNSGYLSGVIRKENSNYYSDNFVIGVFHKAKKAVKKGKVKKSLRIPTNNSPNENKAPTVIEEDKKEVNVIVTNFDNKKQIVIKVEENQLKGIEIFYEKLKENGIVSENSSIITLS